MVDRQAFVEMTRRNIAHSRDGDAPSQAPGVYRVPASNYLDPERWGRETDRIFKRSPLMLSLSGEIASPGQYKAMTVLDTPVLLTRGSDGQARAFVNSCSHRGAVLVEDGSGTARRFACPYHNWTYNPEGDLVGVTDRRWFGELDTSCLGLTPLPVAERAGMVFVVLKPGATMDIDQFLGGYDGVLEHFGFDRFELQWRQSIAGPNWKVAFDGYLDFYHLPFLHRDTFGTEISNRAVYTAWGPHQRVHSPDPLLVPLADVPEEEWDLDRMDGGVWTIFPHISFAGDHTGGLLSQLFPGPTWDQSVTVQSWYTAPEVEGRSTGRVSTLRSQEGEGHQAFLRHVVEDEDYYTGLRQQRALATGAKAEVLFGRNEEGAHRFHGWVDKFLGEDAPFSTPLTLDYAGGAVVPHR